MWKKHENRRDLFCSILQRYWTRFIWNWDVLLHGNPTVDLYNSVKLAGGGELGFGVGEEEWGSGEREVLEGFIGRTEGLLDLIVGRYGDAPSPDGGRRTRAPHLSKDSPPWLAKGESSRAEDGVIFCGVGSISKTSLTSISQWMESIYMHGDATYGVGENPSARPRHRRKRRKVDRESSQGEEVVPPIMRSPPAKRLDLRRSGIERNASPRGIPPPLVSVVERSLDDAVAKAAAKTSAPTGIGHRRITSDASQKTSQQDSMFSTQKMMKYLSLGYGSSWTLNRNGFEANDSPDVEDDTDHPSDKVEAQVAGLSTGAQLHEFDPTPDVTDEETEPFVQRLEESIGKFLIGLSGDLENTEFEDESNDERTEGDVPRTGTTIREAPNRILLRTLTVEMSSSRLTERASAKQVPSPPSRSTLDENSSVGKTSRAGSVDGARPIIAHERVQIAVYVHQPFIFVFLFELHTSNLTIPSFYRAIHHTLGPLQKSLLRSTDIERWRERMRDSLGVETNTSSAKNHDQPSLPDSKDVADLHDLLYDPMKGTIRTSIPNIPLPGSIAAKGLHRSNQTVHPITVSGSWYTLGIPIGPSSEDTMNSSSAATLVKTDWTRIEALNVHTHILNTWDATRDKRGGFTDARPSDRESKRTIKTGRNWWIVWMKIGPDDRAMGDSSINRPKEAILVRRAPQEHSSTGREKSQSRSDTRSASSTGKWLLREQPRTRAVSGSASTAPTASTAGAKAVTEGVGFDAKKWVESLLRLTV